MLLGEPDRVFESCVGTLDDKPAPGAFKAIANIHVKEWAYKEPGEWATPEKAGHIRWDMGYKRGPDCGDPGTFGRKNDEDDYWGRRKLFDQCCYENNELDCFNDESCRKTCTFLNGNKQRFIGPDVGYVLDWKVDEEGVPSGCEAFKELFLYVNQTNLRTILCIGYLLTS